MTDASQNFIEMFKRLGDQFKVPQFDVTRIVEHHQRNVEAMSRSWQAVAGGASAVATKQREIMAAAIKDVTEHARSYQPGGDPQEAMAKQALFASKAMEAAITNTRDIRTLVQKSSAEAFQIVQSRMADSYEEIRRSLDKS
jgi:phasin family protein